MINKKLFLFTILSIFLISIISAQVSYCCEKTKAGEPGGWCINAPQEKCDLGNNCGEDSEGNPLPCRSVPTSCESTSYCKLGVCINSKEGTCMPNTPQRVCEGGETPGVWDERDKDDIPQCQLGCCLIGEQAAFVTLTRCKSLASKYGLEINYRMDIQNEVECITSARPKVKGACVFEKEFEKTCKLLTKKECQEMQTGDSDVEFHEGYLCSANSLGTNCGPRGGTTCVEGRDEVYSLDICGNLGNVYDANHWDDPDDDDGYWGKITAPDCDINDDGSKDSSTCGDCDYFLGTTCKADGGKHVCKDLGCKYEDITYQHGETWCSADKDGEGINSPGRRYFRLVCYNGEVSVEPCADFRQEVCTQSEVNTFKTAACRVNMWQDCYSQDNEKDCSNPDKRDCKWVEGVISGRVEEENGEEVNSSCVPKYYPGFDFWEEEGDAESMCSLASQQCLVEYKAGVFEGALVIDPEKEEDINWIVVGDYECMQKCREKCFWDDPLHACDLLCEDDCKDSACVDKDGDIKKDWKDDMEDLCSYMGDCGTGVNFIGEPGYYDDIDELITKTWQEGEEGGGLLGGLLG